VPRYTFKLFDDSGGIEDDVGVSLPNPEVAYRYACDVVLELMNSGNCGRAIGSSMSTRATERKFLKFLS